MRAPGFWWTPDSLLSSALSPLGALYGAIAVRRLRRESWRAPVPVICVGNFVAGGAGKTPVALALAARLTAMGRRPVFLTRGYGGTLREPTQVDLARHDARQTGDEPQLLAALAPTVVAARRDEGARLAATLGDVIVMDDGLQNPALAKTLALAVVDGAVGVGNGRCIPAGPLRAPMDAQWGLVQAVVVVGQGEAGLGVSEVARARGVSVLKARLRPTPASERFRGRRVFAFAGIGRPEKFFRSMREVGAELVRTRSFADHQPYTDRVLARMNEDAERDDLILVTTEKDMARIRASAPALVGRIEMLGIEAVFDDPGALDRLLAAALSAS